MPQKVSFDMPRPLLPSLEACAPYPVDALGEVLGAPLTPSSRPYRYLMPWRHSPS